MVKLLAVFERVIISALIVLMALIILLATIDLAWVIVEGLLQPPWFRFPAAELLDTFGAFLLVLVGIELLDTIRAYLSEHVVHAEIVFMAAIIAVARKVITLDIKDLSPTTLLGIAAIILALSAGHYLLKQVRNHGRWDATLKDREG